MKCSELIRGPKTGLRRPCPGHLDIEGECSHRKYHLRPIRGIYCINKQCEGTDPKVDGISQGTCQDWQRCPCKCHDNISIILAPKKQQRAAIPSKRVYKEPLIVKWIRKYDFKQKLFANPEKYVEFILSKWKKEWGECTAENIATHSSQERPLSQNEVTHVLSSWQQKKTAFVGGEPLRFIKFL